MGDLLRLNLNHKDISRENILQINRYERFFIQQ